MKDSLHTLVYSVVLGAVCATALTAVGSLTAERREMNKKAEKARNIMTVLGVEFGEEISAQEVLEIRKAKVAEKAMGDLRVYTYRHPTEGLLQAVEFGGAGMWGPIKGLLCLKADMRTIHGISFYEQEETPGLGGEIASDKFQGQFKGKTTEDAAGRPGMRIRRGGAVGPNEVDAITSATTTCGKVETMLNAVIERIVQERNQHGR